MSRHSLLRGARWFGASVLLFLAACSAPQDPGEKSLVSWVPLEKASAEAVKTGRPLMYDLMADWCGPCKMLNSAVFNDPEAASYINEHFVPVRVADRVREEGQNSQAVRDLQAKFELRGFPTVAVSSPDGLRLDRLVGYHGKDGTMEFLKRFAESKP